MGVDVSVVERKGSGLFRPQSPLASDDCGVSMAARVGYGSVAVSDLFLVVEVTSWLGRGSGGGMENKRELRRRLAVGESLCARIPIFAPRSIGVESVGGFALESTELR